MYKKALHPAGLDLVGAGHTRHAEQSAGTYTEVSKDPDSLLDM